MQKRTICLNSLGMSYEDVQLAKNLHRLMEKKKINQMTLAEEIGVRQSTINNYCHGSVPSTLSILVKLAKYFNVSLDELVLEPQTQLPNFSAISFLEGQYQVSVTAKRQDFQKKTPAGDSESPEDSLRANKKTGVNS